MDDLVKRANAALEGVTAGPWKHKRTEGRDYGSFSYWVPGICMNLDKEKDARFIAAARELVPEMRDRIEADAKRIERGVNAELLDQQQAMRERIAELEAERDEALRRRDAWRARAENHVEIVNALRAKTAGKDSRTLSRALLGAAFADAEARAEKAEAALSAKDAEIARVTAECARRDRDRADLHEKMAEVKARAEKAEAENERLREAYRLEAMRRPDYTHEAFDAHLAALTGEKG